MDTLSPLSRREQLQRPKGESRGTLPDCSRYFVWDMEGRSVQGEREVSPVPQQCLGTDKSFHGHALPRCHAAMLPCCHGLTATTATDKKV